MDNSFDIIKDNKKLKEGITMIMDAVSETVEKITTEKLASYYLNIGATSVLRGIIGIFNTCTSPESMVEGLNNFLKSCGVVKVETKNNQLNVGQDSAQRIIDVYNDPDDPNTITSITPGYVIKNDSGKDIILQYEDIKINEAHYDNPIELLLKKSDENGNGN